MPQKAHIAIFREEKDDSRTFFDKLHKPVQYPVLNAKKPPRGSGVACDYSMSLR